HVVLVVHAPVVGLLLPDEPRVVVRPRPVAVHPVPARDRRLRRLGGQLREVVSELRLVALDGETKRLAFQVACDPTSGELPAWPSWAPRGARARRRPPRRAARPAAGRTRKPAERRGAPPCTDWSGGPVRRPARVSPAARPSVRSPTW